MGYAANGYPNQWLTRPACHVTECPSTSCDLIAGRARTCLSVSSALAPVVGPLTGIRGRPARHRLSQRPDGYLARMTSTGTGKPQLVLISRRHIWTPTSFPRGGRHSLPTNAGFEALAAWIWYEYGALAPGLEEAWRRRCLARAQAGAAFRAGPGRQDGRGGCSCAGHDGRGIRPSAGELGVAARFGPRWSSQAACGTGWPI